MTLTETLRYRGAIGQWSWVLHRLTGLGVVLFLVLHVVDTSWAVFYPSLYEKAIATYQSPLFTLGEFALVFAVVYHAYNGLRIAIFDAKPMWWRHQNKAAWVVLGLTAITLVPTFVLMFSHVIDFYGEEGSQVLPVGEVLVEQIPFLVGIVVAGIAAVLYSGLTSVFVRKDTPGTGRGSVGERFWWSYMRVSGLLIVPLVFGHLAMMHILQGVFDLTTAHSVVGTAGASSATGIIIGDGFNYSATATEFVAERWSHLVAGVAIWKVYDIVLLMLVTLHGFNGLRYVLTDYTMGNSMMRRAAIYFCLIGGVTLLVVGAGALLGSIDIEAIEMAQEARARLFE